MLNATEKTVIVHAVSQAKQYGFSVNFWIGSGDAKEAGRRARWAAKWAGIAININEREALRLAPKE